MSFGVSSAVLTLLMLPGYTDAIFTTAEILHVDGGAHADKW